MSDKDLYIKSESDLPEKVFVLIIIGLTIVFISICIFKWFRR